MQFEAAFWTLTFSRTRRSLKHGSTLRTARDCAYAGQIHRARPQSVVPSGRTALAFRWWCLPRLFTTRLSIVVLVTRLTVFSHGKSLPKRVATLSTRRCLDGKSGVKNLSRGFTRIFTDKPERSLAGCRQKPRRILSVGATRYNNNMIHEIIPVGPLQCNCSIIGDESSREAMVIDPGDDIESVLALIRKHNLQVKQIVVTHAHIDHVGGAMKLRVATGAPILLNQNDYALLRMLDVQAAWIGMKTPEKVEIDRSVTAGETVSAGSHRAEILHTPGHTEGSICLYFAPEKKLIAGDTLFAGSIGRTDLPGGSMQKIMRSLHNTVLALPDETVVVPGHGELTTIGEERESNPFLVKR